MAPRGSPTVRQNREQGVAKVMEMLESAALVGRKDVASALIMEALGVSKPTALSYKIAARDLLAHRGDFGGDPKALATVPAMIMRDNGDGSAMAGDRQDMFGLGAGLMGMLHRSAQKMEAVQAKVSIDLDQVRYLLYGGSHGLPLPGVCSECHREIEGRIPVKEVPPELQGHLNIGDLSRLYGEFIKAEKAIIDAAKATNDALEIWYGTEAKERFMADLEQAIIDIAPESAHAIAKRVRELGMGRGNR